MGVGAGRRRPRPPHLSDHGQRRAVPRAVGGRARRLPALPRSLLRSLCRPGRAARPGCGRRPARRGRRRRARPARERPPSFGTTEGQGDSMTTATTTPFPTTAYLATARDLYLGWVDASLDAQQRAARVARVWIDETL